jgi:hypothetical protein
MSISLTDNTAATQRIATSTSVAIEFGPAVPTDGLTVRGNPILAGPTLAPDTIPPAGLNRITGTVTLTSKVATTVNVGQPLAGFGTVDGATIIRFNGSSFTAALTTNTDGVTKTCGYSVI